ncbi:MAG TPA: nitrite reductase small subunit NirD [Gammaproteobacteria bacterium]|nr:nitrite reductase small subunit NirD [Gammaproteobacteria bacterium]
MSRWIEIGNLDDIPVLGSRIVQTPRGDIALFRTGSGAVFALRDRCPHKQGPISQGMVHGTTVTCPLHNWEIDLETGAALPPDEGCTNTYATRIENGVVMIELGAS